jgi:hypothetical protein
MYTNKEELINKVIELLELNDDTFKLECSINLYHEVKDTLRALAIAHKYQLNEVSTVGGWVLRFTSEEYLISDRYDKQEATI